MQDIVPTLIHLPIFYIDTENDVMHLKARIN